MSIQGIKQLLLKNGKQWKEFLKQNMDTKYQYTSTVKEFKNIAALKEKQYLKDQEWLD